MDDNGISREIRSIEFTPRMLPSVSASIASRMASLKEKAPSRRKIPTPKFKWPDVTWQQVGESRTSSLIDHARERLDVWLSNLLIPADSAERIRNELEDLLTPILERGVTITEYSRQGCNSPFGKRRKNCSRVIHVQLAEIESLWVDFQDMDIYPAGNEPIFYIPSRPDFRLFELLDSNQLHEQLLYELWERLEKLADAETFKHINGAIPDLIPVIEVNRKFRSELGIPAEILAFADMLREKMAMPGKYPLSLMSHEFKRIWRCWDNYKRIRDVEPALLRTFHLATMEQHYDMEQHYGWESDMPNLLGVLQEWFNNRGVSSQSWQQWRKGGEAYIKRHNWDPRSLDDIAGLLSVADIFSDHRLPEFRFFMRLIELHKRLGDFSGLSATWFRIPKNIMVLLVRRAEILEADDTLYSRFIDQDMARLFMWAHAYYVEITNRNSAYSWEEASEQAMRWRDILSGFTPLKRTLPKRVTLDGLKFTRLFDPIRMEHAGHRHGTFFYRISESLKRADRGFYEVIRSSDKSVVVHAEYCFDPTSFKWVLGRAESPRFHKPDDKVISALQEFLLHLKQ